MKGMRIFPKLSVSHPVMKLVGDATKFTLNYSRGNGRRKLPIIGSPSLTHLRRRNQR